MTTSTPNSKSTDPHIPTNHRLSAHELTADDFRRMARLLYDKSGIHLTPVKKTLLEGRIKKRQSILGLASAAEYCEYLLSPQGQIEELEFFINALTTNKTDFMREFGHFQYLVDVALPQLLQKRNQLQFWSAACSRGAEPYTLAMVLEEYNRMNPQIGMRYQILATDISTKVLQEAIQAVYVESDIHPIPQDWRGRYLLRGKGDRQGQYRICPDIRAKVKFLHMNLMESFPIEEPQDVIFCRNVTIYFDRETQNRLIRKFLSVLQPNGYLIMGHSESLDLQANPIKLCAPSIYQRT